MGSLLFGGGPVASRHTKENKENMEPENKQMETSPVAEAPASMKRDDGKGSYHMSDAEKVREFTFEAGSSVPERPQLMGIQEVNFITKMILDEVRHILRHRYGASPSPQHNISRFF